METTGLIGSSIENSLSPFLHNTAYSILHLPYQYELFPIMDENINSIKQILTAQQLKGFNVTMPYKETILPLLPEVSKAASLCGSVNTVYQRNHQYFGDTTDGQGFLLSLYNAGYELNNKKVCVLGSGGACRSIIAALSSEPVQEIKIIHRSVSDHESFHQLCYTLTQLYSCPIYLQYNSLDDAYRETVHNCDLLINTTNQENSLLCPEQLHKGQLVYDIIYHPWTTRLLSFATHAGCHIMNGFEMLLYQASLSHALFTETNMPVSRIRDLFYELGGKDELSGDSISSHN